MADNNKIQELFEIQRLELMNGKFSKSVRSNHLDANRRTSSPTGSQEFLYAEP